MIKEFFGFKDDPFKSAVDLNFLFWSTTIKEGYARVLYQILEAKGGLSLILGEVGCGKTTLAKLLERDLKSRGKEPFLLQDPLISSYAFLSKLYRTFSGEQDSPRSKNILREYLEKIFKERPFKCILLLDEAQLIKKPLLEEMRLLLNMETEEGKLFQIVLFGQPELKKKLKKYPALMQRISIAYTLIPYSEKETKEYIYHRLKQAGGNKEIFDKEALREIYKVTKGYPRLINTFCSNALFAAFSKDTKKVTKDIINVVKEDFEFHIG
jgi:general secretion pathway protein A